MTVYHACPSNNPNAIYSDNHNEDNADDCANDNHDDEDDEVYNKQTEDADHSSH